MDWIFADHVQVFCFSESGMKQHVHFLCGIRRQLIIKRLDFPRG